MSVRALHGTTILAVLVVVLAGVPADARPPQNDALGRTRAYRSELQSLIPRYERELAAASTTLEQRRALQAEGLASRLEVEAAESLRQKVESEIDDLRRRVTECDQIEAEIGVASEIEESREALPREENAIFYSGTSTWSLRGVPRLETFFAARFGTPMPISARGQTTTHSRLGFSHQDAIDIAVHPDSTEGKGLMEYLREQGISFIAFRRAVEGSATGAHIHVGKPSLRAIPAPAGTSTIAGAGR